MRSPSLKVPASAEHLSVPTSSLKFQLLHTAIASRCSRHDSKLGMLSATDVTWCALAVVCSRVKLCGDAVGGRVTGEAVVAELITELHASAEAAAGFKGDMLRLAGYARCTSHTIRHINPACHNKMYNVLVSSPASVHRVHYSEVLVPQESLEEGSHHPCAGRWRQRWTAARRRAGGVRWSCCARRVWRAWRPPPRGASSATPTLPCCRSPPCPGPRSPSPPPAQARPPQPSSFAEQN